MLADATSAELPGRQARPHSRDPSIDRKPDGAFSFHNPAFEDLRIDVLKTEDWYVCHTAIDMRDIFAQLGLWDDAATRQHAKEGRGHENELRQGGTSYLRMDCNSKRYVNLFRTNKALKRSLDLLFYDL